MRSSYLGKTGAPIGDAMLVVGCKQKTRDLAADGRRAVLEVSAGPKPRALLIAAVA
jgi:hypothetical protein